MEDTRKTSLPAGDALTRRSFFKGMGAAAVAAGALGAVSVAGQAHAEEGTGFALNEYQTIYGGDVNYIPVRKGAGVLPTARLPSRTARLPPTRSRQPRNATCSSSAPASRA